VTRWPEYCERRSGVPRTVSGAQLRTMLDDQERIWQEIRLVFRVDRSRRPGSRNQGNCMTTQSRKNLIEDALLRETIGKLLPR